LRRGDRVGEGGGGLGEQGLAGLEASQVGDCFFLPSGGRGCKGERRLPQLSCPLAAALGCQQHLEVLAGLCVGGCYLSVNVR
jgi:hypothetical protein